MIVQVAILDKENNRVFSLPRPFRHADIHFVLHHLEVSILAAQRVEGFVDDSGKFLTRVEAMAHARSCNQPLIDYWDDLATTNELYSENLW